MLRHGIISLSLGLLLVAFSSTSRAEMIHWTFPINVAQEVPVPTIPPGLNPSGTGIIWLDTNTNLLEWEISYQGLSGDITGAGAHFHGPAPPGVTAGVRIFIAGGTSDFPLPQPPSGTLIGSAIISDAWKTEILDHLWYVNLHTALNPPGEIRGQVVPEPSSLALMTLGGAATALVLYRRQRRSQPQS